MDHLSGGRLDLRLGVGAEDARTGALWRSCGIPYPPAGVRVARLDEDLAILRALLDGERVNHRGPVYTLERARLEPRPVQARLPIWVAAMGPRALDLVARRADGWEASCLTPDDFSRKWTDLQVARRDGQGVFVTVFPDGATRYPDANVWNLGMRQRARDARR